MRQEGSFPWQVDPDGWEEFKKTGDVSSLKSVTELNHSLEELNKNEATK